MVSKNPYFHLVDGGISDNLGLRSVLDVLKHWRPCRRLASPLGSITYIESSSSSSIPCPYPPPVGTIGGPTRNRPYPRKGELGHRSTAIQEKWSKS